MNQTDQDIIQAHQARLARRRAKRKADLDFFHAREASWRRSESGKASLARKKVKDAERAKARAAEYQAALQQVKATAAQTAENPEALRQQAADCIQQVQGKSPAQRYFPPSVKGRTFIVVELL